MHNEGEKMEDPESRPIASREDVTPIFAYQYQYPLGIMGGVVAKNMAQAVEILNGMSIEPFSLTRIGPVINAEGVE